MDSVSQSAEEKKKGNDQSEESKENCNSTPQEDSPDLQHPEQKRDEQSTGSDHASGTTKNSSSSSSEARVEQSPPANPNRSAVEANSVQEQISQSETEKQQAGTEPPIPELTLVGKFEISPITPATETRPEGSLKLECPQSGVDLFQNKSRSVNEKCGTTTFEVNNFRDGNLKIASEPSGGTLSSASSSENELVNDNSLNLCNRESSKNELMQQERKDISESSSYSLSTTNGNNNKSVEPDSCVKRDDDSAANFLENDFVLDSKKVEETAPFGEREAKCLEQVNPSNSAGEGCSSTEDSKTTGNAVCNYTSIKILNMKNETEKCENECKKNILENTEEFSKNNCNQESTENSTEKTSLSSGLNLAATSNTSSTVSSLVEQNAYVTREANVADTAVFQRDKDIKPAVRDCTDFSGSSSNINDNVVSSSNNINSSADDHISSYDLKRICSEVIESGVKSSKSNSLSVVAPESSSGNYMVSTSEHKDGAKVESRLKALIQEKVTEFSNRLERQNSSDSSSSNNPSSNQSYQSATKDFVASKIRHFYDNKSVINANNQENRLNRPESEKIQIKASQNYSGYSNYYTLSKENDSNTPRHSGQSYNPPISSSSTGSSYLDVMRDTLSVGKSEQRHPERSYNQQYTEKVPVQHPTTERTNTSAVTWQTVNQTNYQKPPFDGNYVRESNRSTTMASIAKPHSSTNPNISRISGMDTTSHLLTSKKLSSSAPEQNQQVKINTINSVPFETRETEYQRYVNPTNQGKEKDSKRSNMVLPEQSQYVEPQIPTNPVDQSQSREADYQKYLSMVNHEKENESHRQVIYNQKSMNHTEMASHQVTNSIESLNRPMSTQNQSDIARSSHPQSSMGLLNRSSQIQNHSDSMRRPSPIQNHMDAMRRPSPIQSHVEAIRRPSPVQSHAEVMRRPSPVQIHPEAIRRPSPVQNHAETLRRPSPIQNHLESLRRPSPVQMNSFPHNHSLYINNPDFSKQMLHTQKVSASSNNDLSQLHMKPPDFSKVTPVQQLQQQQRQILSQQDIKAIKERPDCLRQNAPPQITHQNFAEISKKYNYISDLQLKNPAPMEDKSAPGQPKMHYNNLYVKAPDFSSEKFQNRPPFERSSSLDTQQQQQQQQQLQPYPATKPSNSQYIPQQSENSYARQFPQLSHDVELSVVPQKGISYQGEKPSSYCEYQMYNKSSPYAQEAPSKPEEKNVRTSVVNEQYTREQVHYQNRGMPSDYPVSFANNMHLQAREQYPQVTPSRQSYPSDAKLPVRPNEPLAKPYETPRYDPKVQQNTFPQSYIRESFPNYNYPQGTPSVIQSSKAKECYPEYPHAAQNQIKPQTEYSSMNPAHRTGINTSYYMPQQATPPTPPSSASSIPSPSHITNTRLYPNQMQQQQPMSNSSSPICPTQGSYKTTPSPGTMNPPYGWPSQTNNRVPSQGTSASPHTAYRQPSPLGMNAPSPHSQSPSFLQPSPKASPSPTNPMSRPSPQAPSVHMNYKPPYAPPAQQNVPLYYQQVDPNRTGSNTGYFIKTEKPLEKPSYPDPSLKQYKPVDPKQDQAQYRQMEAKQGFRTHEYPPAAAFMQKPTTPKRADFAEYQPPSARKSEPVQGSYKPPPQQLNETATRTDYHPAMVKSTSDININKLNQKPNYREMINHVYAIRNATSEKELNAEIIKRTLKKDITRRSDSDLSKSIFDSPDPTKNCGYFARSVECLPALRAQQEDPKRMESYMVPKYGNNAFDSGRKSTYPPESSKAKSCEYLNRKPTLPLCNELAQNDISVTVSKVIKTSAAENTKPPERSTQSFHGNYPTGSEFSSVVISKVNPSTSVDHSVPNNVRTKETSRPQSSAPELSKPTSSVFNPMKRESPLDLSVKTVKTKADSTGCDDLSSYHSRTSSASTANALKVDFAPNFSKHTVADGSNRTNTQPPSGAYDSRYPNNVAPLQNIRSCAQPSESNKYNVVSQSRPTQQHTQQVNPAQQLSQPAHHQYSSQHHPPSQLPDAQINTRVPSNNFPNVRQDQMYPGHHISQNSSSYPYQPSQIAHMDQKPNAHVITHPQQACFPPTQSLKQQVECQKLKEPTYPSMPGTSSYPPDNKQLNPYGNPYLPPKKESENVKQSVILNPPLPITVFDKKSDDYLVNTPQHQSKIPEKLKETNLPKIARPADQPANLQQKYSEPNQVQENSLRYGSSYLVKNNRPDVPPSTTTNHVDQRYPATNVPKQYPPDLHTQYDRSKYDSKPEEQTKKIDAPKSLNVTFHSSNMVPDQFSQYAGPAPAEPNKPSIDNKMQTPNKVSVDPEHNDSMQDRFRANEYHRKRPPEPTQSSGKNYQSPEKRIRVDELYRAHLEETYRQQHKQQQQQQKNPCQSNLSNQFERRDMSVIQPTGESSRKNETYIQANYATVHHKAPAQYGYPYKEGYQPQYPQQSRESASHVPYQHSQAPQQPWYTQPHPREKGPQESANIVKRESYPYHLQYNDPIVQSNDLERSKIQDQKRQMPLSSEILQKPTPPSTVPSSSSTTNNNVLRGADQNVISKLRNSIEMREYEKQKNSLLKKQSNAGEIGEEESNKPDIASLLAARIRTKGELKGFTPLPPTPPSKVKETEKEITSDNNSSVLAAVPVSVPVSVSVSVPVSIPISIPVSIPVSVAVPVPTSVPLPVLDPFAEGEEAKSLDLLDWGSACNDFVEQLLTGNTKKRKRRRNTKSALNNETNIGKIEDVTKEAPSYPEAEHNCDIVKNDMEQVKPEAEEIKGNIVKDLPKSVKEGGSSSDEDKPLLQLKQQRGSDANTTMTSDADSKTQNLVQPSEGCHDVKSQGSDTTVNSKRSNLVEKLSDKLVRNMREKQRMEQERRLAARLSQTSSSDSDDDIKRTITRQKKPRKPRSRASGASTREMSHTDSSDSEDKIMRRNLMRSRIELRKRRRIERLSTDSESGTNEQAKKPQKLEKDCDKKFRETIQQEDTPLAKKEMITKARVKCMRIYSQTSESSEENDEKPECKERSKTPRKEQSKVEIVPVKKVTSKEETEDESNVDQSKQNSSSPCKLRNKRTLGRQSVEEANIKETMTRSKRKKELEQQIANSKILRNEKIVQNVLPVERKVKGQEKTASKSMKTSEKAAQEEKSTKVFPSKGKSEKSEELKRRHCGNESDEKNKKRRITKEEESSSSSSDSSKESEEQTVSDRVRSRRSRLSNEKHENEILTKTPKKSKIKEKRKDESRKNSTGRSRKSTGKNKVPEPESGANTEKFPPGWELEVYQYKRALKVPASLISIKGPVHHRVSTSLPDLDPHSSDASETFSAENSKQGTPKITTDDVKKPPHPKSSKKGSKSKKDKKEAEAEPELKLDSKKEPEPVIQPKSIIDVLHSRMLTSKRLNKKNSKIICQNNEPKLLPRGSNEAELLPTPASVQDNKNPFANEHHNLFETEVLKSRTRTEYRILKNKELIREVFGGEDRPASAPPEIRDIDEADMKVEAITFDQKYQQYLQKMNIDFGEKIRKNRKPQSLAENNESGATETSGIVIKTEKIDEDSVALLNNVDDETQDTEINECFQTPLAIKEEAIDINERDTPSIISEREGVVTPLIFKRRKGGKNRSGRRKGSSGFDYIRKKKKVTPNANSALDLIKRRRISPVELFHTRDESDVSKEIQKWVLNKSVGQSALHKAARLGYLDVIAYCLERLGMHPDPKDNAGYTPLHEACAKGRIDIARVLLQYGANHSETAHSGIRPLHEASENGYIEIVRLLLSYGADPLLTTYSGQTPLILAEGPEMEQLLKNHLQDVQNTGPHKQPWKFPGPWKIYDAEEYGYNVLEGAPEINDEEELDESSKELKYDITIQKEKDTCDTNSNVMISEEKIKRTSVSEAEGIGLKTRLKSISNKCTVVLDNIDSLEHMNSVKQFNDCHSKLISRRRSTFEKRDSNSGRIPIESEGEGEIFEFEESDMPLPPLYLLKDEGSEKWVLLNDLCNLLKVKSKDTLLKQICPSIPPSTVNKELLRELKMSDFLERATCLQLLCAGEKLNISSSKVVLVKYNDSVRNLLGVKTILMKF